MLSAYGRLDALVHTTSCSKQSSSLGCPPRTAARPALYCCCVSAAHSWPRARHRVYCNEIVASLARKHCSVYLQTFKPVNKRRYNLQCRVSAASETVEQYAFRSATSTEDLRDASVLRAEAYYEVLTPTQCTIHSGGAAQIILAERAASFVTCNQ